MLAVYPACFIKEEKAYSVVFPDLNHLATCGEDEQDATEMAIDCLAGYIHWLQQDGEEIPKPSPVSAIDIKAIAEEFEISVDDIYVVIISVDVEEYAAKHFDKAIKKTLTIPEWIDRAAKKQGINFSKTLQEALLAKIL